MSSESVSMGNVSTTIKPSQIHDLLDMAVAIRAKGGNFIPLFGGHAGIGKTQNVRDWAKAQGKDFHFIDVRLAYMERPDMIGLPTVVTATIDGKEVQTTLYALPEFLPKSGNGILVWEEPNRAPEGNLQTLMQITSEREIGKYKLPDGFIQCGVINPEGTTYSVNTLDTALKNRFVSYDVVYNKVEHVAHMKAHGAHERVIAYVEGGDWQFKAPEELKEGSMFVSPRTFQKLSEIEHYHDANGGVNAKMFRENVIAVLGSEVGSSYYKFAQELKPILFSDFQKDKDNALERLKRMSVKGESYKGDMVAITVNSLTDAFKDGQAQPELIFTVAEIIDLDQAVGLLNNCATDLPIEPEAGYTGLSMKDFFRKAKHFSPEVKELLRRRAAGSLTTEEQQQQAAGAETSSTTAETDKA